MNKTFLAALLIGIEGFVLFSFIMPQYNEWKGARVSLDDRKALLADSTASAERIKTLSDEYSTNEATIAKVLLALPQKKQFDYITESFRSAAQNSGIELDAITVGESVQSSEEYRVISVKVETSGSYPNLLGFLDALEHSLRLYDISKVEIAESRSGLGSQLAITLQVQAYSIK